VVELVGGRFRGQKHSRDPSLPSPLKRTRQEELRGVVVTQCSRSRTDTEAKVAVGRPDAIGGPSLRPKRVTHENEIPGFLKKFWTL